mmetsp:Transcript_30755/g.86192  ORF Transcript_30755/g.86192 Transcript_30755/m.86192 type:complete len:219 (-) Transcript_30755:315-971(-)
MAVRVQEAEVQQHHVRRALRREAAGAVIGARSHRRDVLLQRAHLRHTTVWAGGHQCGHRAPLARCRGQEGDGVLPPRARAGRDAAPWRRTARDSRLLPRGLEHRQGGPCLVQHEVNAPRRFLPVIPLHLHPRALTTDHHAEAPPKIFRPVAVFRQPRVLKVELLPRGHRPRRPIRRRRGRAGEALVAVTNVVGAMQRSRNGDDRILVRRAHPEDGDRH